MSTWTQSSLARSCCSLSVARGPDRGARSSWQVNETLTAGPGTRGQESSAARIPTSSWLSHSSDATGVWKPVPEAVWKPTPVGRVNERGEACEV